jgi:excinuclease ABC subunit C
MGAPDDYASMCEMLRRRFEEYAGAVEKGISVGFGRMPDLILLDGGKGHVGAVTPLLRGMGVTVPVFGMVKDDRHRTRAIAADGAELSMSSLRSAFNLVTAIQDEVHRYSITYSRAKHQSSSLELRLEAAPGIGPTRARALYLRFRSMKAISAATVEELAATPGMNHSSAERLYAYLHDREE